MFNTIKKTNSNLRRKKKVKKTKIKKIITKNNSMIVLYQDQNQNQGLDQGQGQTLKKIIKKREKSHLHPVMIHP